MNDNMKASERQLIAQQIAQFLSSAEKTFTRMSDHMKKAGINIQLNIASTGRISGISFETGGVAFKGSQVDRNYSWAGLIKLGLDFDADRDAAAVTAAKVASAPSLAPPPAEQQEVNTPTQPVEVPRGLASLHAKSTKTTGANVAVDRIRKYCQALPADMYMVGLKSENGSMRNYIWSRDELNSIEKIKFLKYRNFEGDAIYCRPMDNRYVLVDDIKDIEGDFQEKCASIGASPSVITETSPNNFQVWFKISEEAVENAEAKAVSRWLAIILDGDRGSIGYNHYGRLPGFTNRKPKYRNPATGLSPFVLLRLFAFVSAGAVLLAFRRANVASTPAPAPAPAPALILEPPDMDEPGAHRLFRAIRARMEGGEKEKNNSDLDFAAACRLAERGYPAQVIAQAILAGSPGAGNHPNPSDYAQRTALAAVAAVQHRHEGLSL